MAVGISKHLRLQSELGETIARLNDFLQRFGLGASRQRTVSPSVRTDLHPPRGDLAQLVRAHHAALWKTVGEVPSICAADFGCRNENCRRHVALFERRKSEPIKTAEGVIETDDGGSFRTRFTAVHHSQQRTEANNHEGPRLEQIELPLE